MPDQPTAAHLKSICIHHWEFAPGIEVFTEEGDKNHILWDLEKWRLGGHDKINSYSLIIYPWLWGPQGQQGSLRYIVESMLIQAETYDGEFHPEPKPL